MSDDFDDIDLDDEIEEPVDPKKALKDLWDNNPMVKVAGLVGGLVGLYVIFNVFIAPPPEQEAAKSNVKSAAETTGAVGEEVDVAYKKALESKNKEAADRAEKRNESAMPTPIGGIGGGLDVSNTVDDMEEDPLEEWRRAADARRIVIEDFSEEENAFAPIVEKPALVPLVEPIRPQPQEVINQELVGLIADQMATIISSKTPVGAETTVVTSVQSPYSAMLDKIAGQEAMSDLDIQDVSATSDAGQMLASGLDASNGDMANMSQEVMSETVIPAGTVVYGQLLNELDSDVEGPALVQVLSGPLAGGRAIGEFSLQDEYLVITFKVIIKDGVSYTVDGIALDQDTTLAGLASEVDHRYFTRVILPAAAEFVVGMAEAYAETQTSTTATTNTVSEAKPELTTEEEIAKGIQKAGESVSKILVQGGKNKKVNVKVHRGTTMGILFMSGVKEDSVE